MPAKKLTSVLLTGTFVVALGGSALALDGNEFAKTLNSAFADSDGKIDYSRIDVNNDTVVLRGAAIATTAGDALPLGDLTFSGVEEGDDGGYTAETVTMPDVSYKKDGADITLKDIHFDGVDVPPVKPVEGAAPYVVYQSASAGPLTITDANGEILSIANIASTMDQMDNDAGYTSTMSATGLAFHTDHMTSPKSRIAMQQMGYDVVKGHFDAKGSWESDSGKVTLSQFALQLDDIGTLGLTLDLRGYTKAFIKQLRDMQAQVRQHPDDPKAKQALGIGMLGLMQQLSFGGASVRFDDDSFTKRALDYAGKQQGVSGDQMAKAAEAMLPMALARLKNPEFQQQIVDAVSAFLDDPKTLSVRAEPTAPVAVPTIMGAAMASPQTLPGVLNVKVEANK